MAEVEKSVRITKGQNVVDKVVVTKLNTDMVCYLRPLLVQGHINRVPIPEIMANNILTMNIFLNSMMKMLRKSTNDLVPANIVVSSFTGGVTDTWGILPLDMRVG
ncbi:hypothetical protein ACH5RR_007231 [Cinchona calisaya]|uniref:Uncharacterized protein n=1 Tax=Cinchona calisaya TaxID=153742 RepID=A0ABD3ARA4_9GENT